MTHLALPTPRGMVLGDVIPGDRVRDVALVLAGAALTALGAQISIQTGASPVPITGQTLAVVLAGGALGFLGPLCILWHGHHERGYRLTQGSTGDAATGATW